jgi:hypothetical protein
MMVNAAGATVSVTGVWVTTSPSSSTGNGGSEARSIRRARTRVT